MSLRYVCRNVARVVAQAAVLLIVCGSDVSLKGVFKSVAQECRAVLPRSVVQRCRSGVSLKSVAYMCVCVFSQKCCSEVLIRSIGSE